MNRRPRVLLADDHTMLLDAFRRLLEPRCEIVGTACDGRALLELAASTQPDVIVLDIAMPRLNGMDACAQLRRKMPGVRLVFLTVNEDPDIAAEAIRLGASGYLLKNSASGRAFHRHRAGARGQDLRHAARYQGRAARCFPPPGHEACLGEAHRAPARSAATPRGRPRDEGSRGPPPGKPAHRGLSQIHHHGTARREDECRAGAICSRARNVEKGRLSSHGSAC